LLSHGRAPGSGRRGILTALEMTVCCGREAVAAWADRRNAEIHTIDWQFTSENARIKLRRLSGKWRSSVRETLATATGGLPL